eukprot:GHUV01042262.1.p1 GENE.GHUV01042262.1~~GHUV01042262.1.p1  ORF type:complete len:159 (+),score=7.94 GHUV01042262.1:257-733(+)
MQHQTPWHTLGVAMPWASTRQNTTTFCFVAPQEIEPQPGFYQPYNTNFTARDVAYNFRYPAAQLGPNTYSRPGPVLPQPGAPKDADSSGTPAPGAYKNLYHADVIPGVATTIWLTSYSPYDVNGFTKSSEQYVWLKNTLENIDRRRTPWLIVNWHAPV